MSWFRPITAGDPNAGAAYWGSPFADALAGMTGFVAGREQAAQAQAAAEQQRIENERAAAELADKRRQTDIKAGQLDLATAKFEHERRGDEADRAGKDAALLELSAQASNLLNESRMGNAAAMSQLRLAGLGLTELQAAIENPGPATDESIALAVQVLAAQKKDVNLSETDELNIRTTQAAMQEFVQRRQAGEDIRLTGPGFLELREATRQRLVADEARAKAAGRPAGAAADAEPSPGELAAARIIEIMTEDPADPRAFESRVGASIEAYGVAGLDPGEAPPGSTARAYLESPDIAQTGRADKIFRSRQVFADLSDSEMAVAARIVSGALSQDAMAEINVLPAGGDPAAAVLGP